MSKLFTKQVPRIVTLEFKLKMVEISGTHFQDNPHNFLLRLENQDETWVQKFELESKIQSKQGYTLVLSSW